MLIFRTDIVAFAYVSYMYSSYLATTSISALKRLGFADTDMSSITELFSDADDAFFDRIMTNSEHVLQPFLPEKPDLSYNLRERTHNRSLITKTIDLTELNKTF